MSMPTGDRTSRIRIAGQSRGANLQRHRNHNLVHALELNCNHRSYRAARSRGLRRYQELGNSSAKTPPRTAVAGDLVQNNQDIYESSALDLLGVLMQLYSCKQDRIHIHQEAPFPASERLRLAAQMLQAWRSRVAPTQTHCSLASSRVLAYKSRSIPTFSFSTWSKMENHDLPSPFTQLHRKRPMQQPPDPQ